jgi:hypothetical protein
MGLLNMPENYNFPIDSEPSNQASRAFEFGYADGNHVLLDEFAVVNTCIEASRHNIETAVVRSDVEQDVRVVARKLPELRGKHRRGGKAR